MDEGTGKKEVYANALTVTNTFFDFIFAFKKESIHEENGNQVKNIENVADVRMSPQMAKAFSKLLQENIRTYEEQFGEIPQLPE